MNPQDWLLLRYLIAGVTKLGKWLVQLGGLLKRTLRLPEDPLPQANGNVLLHTTGALEVSVKMNEEQRRSNVQLRTELDDVKDRLSKSEEREQKCQEDLAAIRSRIEILSSIHPNTGETLKGGQVNP